MYTRGAPEGLRRTLLGLSGSFAGRFIGLVFTGLAGRETDGLRLEGRDEEDTEFGRQSLISE